MKNIYRILISFCVAWILIMICATQAVAFCGFYVSGANAKLFDRASPVIIARNDDRPILMMTNYYQESVKYLATVVPVAVTINKQ